MLFPQAPKGTSVFTTKSLQTSTLSHHWFSLLSALYRLATDVLCKSRYSCIAPRLPWLESHLGHWYWDVPSYAHRYVEHGESLPLLGEGPEAEHIWEQRAKPCPVLAQKCDAAVAPHRAPPRDRSSSSCTQAPYRSPTPKPLDSAGSAL